jgi:hypothetical protein
MGVVIHDENFKIINVGCVFYYVRGDRCGDLPTDNIEDGGTPSDLYEVFVACHRIAFPMPKV